MKMPSVNLPAFIGCIHATCLTVFTIMTALLRRFLSRVTVAIGGGAASLAKSVLGQWLIPLSQATETMGQAEFWKAAEYE